MHPQEPETLNRLSFRLEESDRRLCALPMVDGRPLPAWVLEGTLASGACPPEPQAYAGLQLKDLLAHPYHLLGQASRSFATDDGRPYLLGCACHIPDCGPLAAQIRVGQNTVVWSRFGRGMQGIEDTGMGPMVFDLGQYARELELLALRRPITDKR